ncbi:putative acylphosphate phosphohydrolase [hydrocarbon metagenome]|uniref:Putative acylphosphate phosphohydrolase n=1 Tax=hydrocarbon metagenome TaxID=938273 RepID=A0A0W8G635_9ZZZZ
MEKSLHCVISGKVQGVYFRAFVQEQAQSLGLRGWVRNLADGKLEVLAQGDGEAQKALVDLLWQGPAMARVEHVETSHIDYDKTYPGFEIRG